MNVSIDKNLEENYNFVHFYDQLLQTGRRLEVHYRTIESKVMIRALLVQCAMVVVAIESIDRYLHSKGPASYIIYQSGDNKNENTF